MPIIALTANAMLGTKKELMDGGMNDFLTKPIQSERLQEVLETWVPKDKKLPNTGKEDTAVPDPANEETELETISDPYMRSLLEYAGVDTLAGLGNIDFDEDMYIQSLTLFMERLPYTILLIDDLTEQQNLRELRVHTHGLKGSLAIIGATKLSRDAHMLEAAAIDDNVDVCRALLPSFIQKLQAFHETLREAFPDGNNPVQSIPFDEKQFNSNLQRLYTALGAYDYEAVTSGLDAVLSMEYDSEKRNAVSQLKLLIDSFNYPGAIDLIRDDLTISSEYFGGDGNEDL